MAQSALGSFAAPFQPTQEAINPLQALIQGFQLPQQIQDQALAQQLNNALIKQKIMDLQNPDAALARQIREKLAVQAAVDPNSGFYQAPAGLEGIIIQNPGALTPAQQATLPSNDLLNLREAALSQGGVPSPAFVQPTAPAGLPDRNVSINGVQTGMNQNLNTIIKAAQDAANQKQQGLQQASDIIQNRQIAVDTAKEESKARTAGDKLTNVAPGSKVINKEGKIIFENPAAEKTPKNTVVHPGDSVLDAQNNVIYTAPLGAGAGLKPTGEEDQKFRTTINVFTTLSDVGKKVDEFEKTKKFPGATQTFINQVLTQKPDDIPGAGLIPGAAGVYAAFQQKLRDAQTPESRQYEAMRAELTANIIRAQAGLSQTSGEIANVTPYTPQVSDTLESLKDKLSNLKRIAERDLGSFQLIYPAFRGIEIPGYKPKTQTDSGETSKENDPLGLF